MGLDSSTDAHNPKIVGVTNEALIAINGISTKALLDTGSCVSVISESFYNQHLYSAPICTLDSLLRIECSEGNSLPYLGYIQAELTIDERLPKPNPQTCVFFQSRLIPSFQRLRLSFLAQIYSKNYCQIAAKTMELSFYRRLSYIHFGI